MGLAWELFQWKCFICAWSVVSSFAAWDDTIIFWARSLNPSVAIWGVRTSAAYLKEAEGLRICSFDNKSLGRNQPRKNKVEHNDGLLTFADSPFTYLVFFGQLMRCRPSFLQCVCVHCLCTCVTIRFFFFFSFTFACFTNHCDKTVTLILFLKASGKRTFPTDKPLFARSLPLLLYIWILYYCILYITQMGLFLCFFLGKWQYFPNISFSVFAGSLMLSYFVSFSG